MITAVKTDKGYQLVALSQKTGQPFMKIKNFGPYKTVKTANNGLKRAAALFNTECKEVQE